MNWRFFLMLSFLMPSAHLLAQKSDREMSGWLNDAGHGAMQQRLTSLGVAASAAAAFENQHDKAIDWTTIRTGTPEAYAVLFLPCTLDTAYLYVMQYDGSVWHATDSEHFDCHYKMNVGYELAPVLKAGRDCIVVHHVGAGHGGNISVHEINIFSIAAGKLKLVLATQEEMLVAQFGGPATETTDERSTFVFLPGKSAHPYVVEQTRSTTVNEDKLTVERRYFRWSAAAGMYVPSKFRPVLATQN